MRKRKKPDPPPKMLGRFCVGTGKRGAQWWNHWGDADRSVRSVRQFAARASDPKLKAHFEVEIKELEIILLALKHWDKQRIVYGAPILVPSDWVGDCAGARWVCALPGEYWGNGDMAYPCKLWYGKGDTGLADVPKRELIALSALAEAEGYKPTHLNISEQPKTGGYRVRWGDLPTNLAILEDSELVR